jgi:hypothetical protein
MLEINIMVVDSSTFFISEDRTETMVVSYETALIRSKPIERIKRDINLDSNSLLEKSDEGFLDKGDERNIS